MYQPNLKSVAVKPVPEIIVIEFWGVANSKSWGRGSRRGSALVPFKRTFVTSYRFSIVTFPLSLRVSEILLLFCAPARHIFPPHL